MTTPNPQIANLGRPLGKQFAFMGADGVFRTADQINAAFACCRQLELAYELANPDTGGSGSVNWSDVDLAREYAADAITNDEQAAISARACNENQTAAALDEPPLSYEFKRADDTEGGTPD